MSEEHKEFIRQRFMTFNSEQEVCDELNIDVEAILEAFSEKLQEYVQTHDE